MDWCRVALLLSFLIAVGSTQRGGRRYVPDQPLEESLSVENHRFRSRSRDVSGESRRGEGRRPAVELSTEVNLLHSGRSRGRTEDSGRSRGRTEDSVRSRGRTEEPRQFHSIPPSPDSESKQFQSRRNSETERKRIAPREGEPNERTRAREEATESSRGRRGRAREEGGGNRRGSVAGATRFPSRTVEDTVSESTNHEPARNRATEGRRSRNQASRRNNLHEETRSLPRPAAVQAPTERISGRTSAEPFIQKTEEISAKTELINESPDNTGNPDLSAKINGIPESTQFISPENEAVRSSSVDEAEPSGKSKEVDTESTSPAKVSNGFEDSKSTLKTAPVSTENTIEYPTLNDVEESQRASRKLDVTERTQNPRGRNRISDETVRRRLPDSSFESGENTEILRGRGRNIELRSRSRGSEEATRSRTGATSRGSNVDSTARSRNVLDATRSSGIESTPRTRGGDYPSRTRTPDEVPRASLSASSRNNRIENAVKHRESEETPRSRQAENSVRGLAETRGRSSGESRGRSHEEERVKTHSGQRRRPQSSDDRSRPQSTVDNASNNAASKSGRSRLDTRGRNQDLPSRTSEGRNQDLPSRTSEGRRSSHKYSAKIPETPQVLNEGDKTNNKPLFRARSKDFTNFRSRVKSEDVAELSKPVTQETFVSPSVATEATGSLEQADQPKGERLADEKNEITIGVPTEGLATSTGKPLGRSLTRKPLANIGTRGRGHVKGPKLFEGKENSGEVSDDDNYPEVYKQLKKSGTNPKEILALLKARKAAQEKVDSSKPQITQPDASLKPSQREKNYNGEDIKNTREEEVSTLRSATKFHPRNRKTDDIINQKSQSKEVTNRNLEQSDERVESRNAERQYQSRFQGGSLRSQKNEKVNQKTDLENVEENHKPEEQSKVRRYNSWNKRPDYQNLRRKKVTEAPTTVSTQLKEKEKSDENDVYQVSPARQTEDENDEQNSLDPKKGFIQLGTSRFKTSNQNRQVTQVPPTGEAETERDKVKPTYVPKNRARDYEKFKARTERTTDFVSFETPIKPKYSLYNRNEGPKYNRRTFTTPTSQGEDMSTSKQAKSSLFTSRNRPPYLPPKKTYTTKLTTPLPLSRYRARKASLSKLISEDDLKVDNSEDHKLTLSTEVEEYEELVPNFNGLNVDSLVSESEHSSFTTEPQTEIKSTTKRRFKYGGSNIQRIPPKRKGSYSRATLHSTTTEEFSTSPSTPDPGVTVQTLGSLSDQNEKSDINGITTILSLIPSILTTEELNAIITSEMATESTTLPPTTTIPTTTTSPTTTTLTIPTITTGIHTTTKEPATNPSTATTTPATTTTIPTTTTPTTTTTTPTTTTTIPTTTTTTPTTTTPTTTTTTTTPTTTTTKTTTTPTTTTIPTTTTTEITTTTMTTTTTTTTTTKKPTTTTAKKPTTTTTKKPTTTTKKPTTTTTRKPTTTTKKRTTTTKKPTTTTTKKPSTTTTKKPTTTTKKPTTTTTKKPTPTTSKKPTTATTKKPTTTTKKPTTSTTKKPLTTTKPLPSTTITVAAIAKTTTKPRITTPLLPKTVQTTAAPPKSTTFKIDSVLSTTHPTFLSTIAYLAQNLSVNPTEFEPVNTADIRTTKKPVENTTPIYQEDNYVVYGLLPNNNVVRKVIKTTKAPIDIPFIIYGLYPNGTIVRRFPNGTVIPEETEEENEVIGSIGPGSQEELETVVKKDSPLSYLYPPGMNQRTRGKNYLASKSEQTSKVYESLSIQNQISSTNKPVTERSSVKTTTNPLTTKLATTTSKPTITSTHKPTSTTKKPTTKKPTTPTTKKPTTTTTKKPTTSTTKKPTTSTTKKPTTSTTKKPTTSTTKKPTTSTTKKPTAATKNSPSTTRRVTTQKTTTAKPKTTTKKTQMSTTTKKPSTTTTQMPPSAKLSKTSTTSKPAVKASSTVKTVKPSTVTSPTVPHTTKINKASTVSSNVKQDSKKQTTAQASTPQPTTAAKSTTSKHSEGNSDLSRSKSTAKPTIPLSDLEILNNLLSQTNDGKVFSGTTESTEVLANKVIQLAIERAQKSTLSPELKEFGGSDLQSLSSTASPVSLGSNSPKEQAERGNKAGKISVWVLPPDESTTSNSQANAVSQSDAALLTSLLSTPNSLENLSLKDQLLLADALSSTAFPQTTQKKKKKKKRPKATTTTTTPSPFPILRYIFGRNRGGGGLFQRGLFRGGGLGFRAIEAGSSPLVQESPGGIFQSQNEGADQPQAEVATESQDTQLAEPQQGPGLVNAAINVSRAVSQFMGFVIQGAAQSFQNYLQTRTRALAEALAYPPAS